MTLVDLDADLTVARVRRTLQNSGGTLQFVEPKTSFLQGGRATGVRASLPRTATG